MTQAANLGQSWLQERGGVPICIIPCFTSVPQLFRKPHTPCITSAQTVIEAEIFTFHSTITDSLAYEVLFQASSHRSNTLMRPTYEAGMLTFLRAFWLLTAITLLNAKILYVEGYGQAVLSSSDCSHPPYTIQVFSKSPLVIYVSDFLTLDEATHLQKIT